MQNQRVDKSLIDQTISEWQPSSYKEMTAQDAEEIINDIVGFFSLLLEWEKKSDD